MPNTIPVNISYEAADAITVVALTHHRSLIAALIDKAVADHRERDWEKYEWEDLIYNSKLKQALDVVIHEFEPK